MFDWTEIGLAPAREAENDQPPRRQDAPSPSRSAGRGGQDENDGDQGERPPRRTRWPLVALGLGIAAAAVAATIYWYQTKDQQTTDDAYTDGRAVIIAPHVSGYVTVLAVDDNQFVHAGDLLVQIERKDFLAVQHQAASQLAAIEAQLDSGRIALDKARVTFPAQLTQAQGQFIEAQGRLFQAERDYQRQHRIARAATTQQSVDSSTANQRIARGQLDQAKGQLRRAELVRQNIAQAEARVKQLEAERRQTQAKLDLAAIDLGYTRVTAPHDGWVTRRNVEMGNYLQAGTQIMAIVEPEVWVTANFKETALARMRPGQRVRIHVDAYPDLRLEGHVDSIQKGSGARFSAFPPENATGNYVKIVQRVPVKIVIDSGLDPARPLPLGLSVEPTVYLR